MSLAARELEANGIPTIIIGSAKDIVEYCGVPRFLFVDFPLGNPCARPYDEASRRHIMSEALDLLGSASAPRSTQVSSLQWRNGSAWKDNYMHVGPDNLAALRAAGEARRREQAEIRSRILQK